MNIEINDLGQSVASLDVDLIDINDTGGLEDATYVSAFNLCKNQVLDLNKLISLLKLSIEGSDNNEFALLLTKATNVDWLYDEQTEEALKFVAEKLQEGINHYTNLNRADQVTD